MRATLYVAFIFPCLEIFIYFTIIIGLANWRPYLYSLSSISGTPANSTSLQYHGVAHFSLLCQKKGISEPTIQALLESIDPKTLSLYLGIWKRFCNWINNSENDMYNKDYASSTLNFMRSALKKISSPSNDFANAIFIS